MFPGWRQAKIAIIHGVMLAPTTHILGLATAVSWDDNFLGDEWVTNPTLIVYRFSYEQSIGALLSLWQRQQLGSFSA
jgi:hypothetical protein